MRVRRLEASDEPQVLSINLSSRPGVAPLDSAELRRLCSVANYHIVAERSPGEIIGYLSAFDNDADYDGEEFRTFRKNVSAPYIYIDQIAVAEASKKTGVGRLLYEALGSMAHENAISTMCCEVNQVPPNPVSRAFHEKPGFRRLSTMTTSDQRFVELMVRGVCANTRTET